MLGGASSALIVDVGVGTVVMSGWFSSLQVYATPGPAVRTGVTTSDLGRRLTAKVAVGRSGPRRRSAGRRPTRYAGVDEVLDTSLSPVLIRGGRAPGRSIPRRATPRQ